MRSDRTRVALFALLGLATAPPARADLRIVQVVTTAGHDGAKPGQKMTLTPPPLGVAPGTPDNTVRVTLSVRGTSCRADDGTFSTIIDQATRRQTFLDRRRKTYAQSDWDPASVPGTRGAALDVHPTGSAARMLGHPAHEYVLAGTLQGYPVSGTVWTADDLAQPMIPSALGGQATPAWGDRVPGLVLKSNLFLGVPGTAVTWHLQTQAVSLSVAPLPASAFAVPHGYKAVQGK